MQPVVIDTRPGAGGNIAAEVAAKAAPDVRERLIGQGLEPVGSTPEQFAARVASEMKKLTSIVKRSGAHID